MASLNEINNSLMNVALATTSEEANPTELNQMDIEVQTFNLAQNEFGYQYSSSATTSTGSASPIYLSFEERIKADRNSVYVGNVDYGTTTAVLEEHFASCGVANRITIPMSKYSSCPKGFAYVEFLEHSSVELALKMDGSVLRGRQIKVMPKRTNIPGFSTTNRPPRRGAPTYPERPTQLPSIGFTGGFVHPFGYAGQGGQFSHLTPY